ncbi:Crp/Fnr family transcriptional regulator [Sphingomonas oligophenolica]|uniref:Crp/Fnr family transcriptional regulator n=1 Tax=Sphingomonas oligophenolica TaxID=301154 RepID=A0ABU9Y180_9SPHN
MLTASPLIPMLRKLEYWATLAEADREALLTLPYILKTIEPKGMIVREGDQTTHACVIRSGFVYRHKVVANGARQIVSLHMSGDLVDLQNALLHTADHYVQALTRSELAMVPRAAIRRIAADRPAIGEAMWHDTLVDGSIFREWIANVGRRDARTRLAHLLCEFALRLAAAGIGEENGYELPMTQEQLGDCTGLTPVHVNRMLKSLSDDGLIHRSKRAVAIADWQGLLIAGDFQSGYLHLPDEKVAMMR